MNKIIRLYNQNRNVFWFSLIVIAFIIILIQVFNYLAAHKLEKQNEETMQEASIPKPVYNKDESNLGLGEARERLQQESTNLIDNFMQFCNNKEPDKAYELLTPECKEVLYPDLQTFIDTYYEPIFNSVKTFNYQFRSGDTYEVRILDDILATGGQASVYRDYFTIVKNQETDSYLLNINSYIGRTMIGARKETNNIAIEVQYEDQYIDNVIYKIKIINNTDQDILLDSREKTDSMYLYDENEVNHTALSYELTKEQLQIAARQECEVEIKFNSSYTTGRVIEQVVFSDIITNKNLYDSLENKNQYQERVEIRVDV